MTSTITEPGFYFDVSEKVYHADPCPAPALSSGIAKVLIDQSPGHAWWQHPRLNVGGVPESLSSKAQGKGTALHRLILGRGRELAVLVFDNYTTKAAKAARDEAIAAGHTPILEKDHAVALEAAAAVQLRLADSSIAHLLGPDKGDAEVTGVWRERAGIWCKMRLDWLPHAARAGGHITVIDLKTTGESARAEDWSRSMFNYGGDVQDAFYRRGLKALIPNAKRIDFVFVVIEQKPPFAVQLCRSSGQTKDEAEATVGLAIETWAQCLKLGTGLEHWPFYDGEVADIDPPIWHSMATEMNRLRMLNRLAQWQRPLTA